jgi:hypothetical protein
VIKGQGNQHAMTGLMPLTSKGRFHSETAFTAILLTSAYCLIKRCANDLLTVNTSTIYYPINS